MINRSSLLSDLQSVLRQLEADLIQRSTSPDVPEVGTWLQAEFAKASEAKRTAQNYTDWLNDYATQVAAAWVLSCVFARFLEDNALYETPMIAGPTTSPLPLGEGQGEGRLQRAKDERELYFRQHPGLTDRDYLLHVFQTLRDLRGGIVKEVFGGHNPVNELPNWLGPDAAGILLRFFQQIDPNTGDIRHDFTDPNWDTRFLGDLYQDLSEAARKKYALLQTPEFVEEFILDRTLDPALDEFTLTPSPPSAGEGRGEGAAVQSRFKMIDPACGSGHFLLGTFPRILNRWQRQEPATNVRELVQRTLDSIHGVDINPFAIAIARFRLLLAAMRACNITRLIDAPAFRVNLVCGDSLLHVPLKSGGTKFTKGQREFSQMLDGESDNTKESPESLHSYMSEDLPLLKRILKPGQYHAVVANPPYITPKDKALGEQYRNRFQSCHRQYSLAVPFMEQLFRLAAFGGFTGQITANSFMKREFGKKLIESFFPTVDLTHVIDTSGAYIPGHGTPTVILFGRNRSPVARTLRAIMGIKGEPSTPVEPSEGLVWSAIITQIDQPGSESDFVTVSDPSLQLFHSHPWSIGGGGATELKQIIDEASSEELGTVVVAIGRGMHTGSDDAYFAPKRCMKRFGVTEKHVISAVKGEDVRDWEIAANQEVLFPYNAKLQASEPLPADLVRYLWGVRTILRDRKEFGGRHEEIGLTWFEWSRFHPERLSAQQRIGTANIATHFHAVIDRGRKVYDVTAPMIMLLPTATENDNLAMLGVLNSSTACFWMKQVCFPKGGDHVGQEGARVRRTAWDERFAFNGTNLERFPLPTGRPLIMARYLDSVATQAAGCQPASVARLGTPTQSGLNLAKSLGQFARQQMIAAQEELDWECYHLYGLTGTPLTRSADTSPAMTKGRSLECAALSACVGIELGQRAFEIVLARKMAAGETQSTWFERHGSTPITELPAEWPDDYRQLVERRIALIESDPNIRLIEQPEYKRRWNTESWDSQLERALREWLLNRLESYFDFDGRMRSGDQGTGVGDQGESSGQGAGIGDQGESQTAAAESRAPSPDLHMAPPALAAIQLYSIAKLADVASKDADFMQVAELYRDDPAFNVLALVEELVNAETVPLLPILRYKDSGLRKRQEWEKMWELQRREDAASDQLAVVSRQLEQANDPVEIRRLQELVEKLKTENSKLTTSVAVPPKYDSKDFLNANFWRLRGKLDVPKERWISFPGAEAEDGSLMIAWAGYDHLQQAQAISAWYVEIRDQQGGHNDKRLIALLACLLELLPWIKQWHNSSDNEFNMAMGDFFEGFIKEESRQLPRPSTEPTELDGEDLFPDAAAAITYGWSLFEIQAWRPSAKRPAKRAAKKAAAPKKASKKAAKKKSDNDTE
jgi:hypothetical protein